MIKFLNNCNDLPYLMFREKYDHAYNQGQESIEAISISSYLKYSGEVNSRFVNLKFIDNKDFIFFTNYNSQKSKEFKNHSQISALIYWNKTNVQIRIKSTIRETSAKYNNDYFRQRSKEKNALALSSQQSVPIDSYESVKKNFNKYLKKGNLNECPSYWGGYSFTPYYFEFWEGHKSRINRREVFSLENNKWKKFLLQP